MQRPAIVPSRFVSLKGHPDFNERWLHEHLLQNPSLLGLGDIQVRQSERSQPSGGRLDLLLYDPENYTRYEVEIQLGAMDESHIIRTIEYWDLERRRYPQYDHIAVIVAEDVTSRFLNVINLLNGQVPLIAIQLKAVEVGDVLTLVATRVVDLFIMGRDEEDEGETVDRASWERVASPNSLKTMDALVQLIKEVDPAVAPKYNKYYIGLTSAGAIRNFVEFRPRKVNVTTAFKIPQEDGLTERLEESGLATMSYDNRSGAYRVQVRDGDIENHRALFLDLIRRSRDAHIRT